MGSPSILSQTPAPTELLNARDLAEARRFREDYGLRSDESWIRQVSADPTAAQGKARYGVPLTPDEVAELERRSRTTEAIKRLVVPYGQAHPDDWAGDWIDHDNGGRYIAQFSGHIEEHRAALYGRVSPDANFEVRAVARSLAELRALAAVLDDPNHGRWFATIPAVLKGYGPNIASNRLHLDISSPVAEAGVMIEEKFGWHGVVEVQSDGTGASLLETGMLRVVVTDEQGKPVRGLRCIADADLVGAYGDTTLFPETDARGRCDLDLPATGYWIRLQRRGGALVALIRAVVLPGQTSTVEASVQDGAVGP